MNISDSFKKLSEFVGESDSTNLLIFAGDNSIDYGTDESIIQQITIAQELEDKFKEIVLNIVEREIINSCFHEYEPGYKLGSHEICYMKIQSNSQVFDIIQISTNF